MPGYDYTVVFRAMAKTDLIAAVERVGKFMLEKKAIIEKIESHYTRDLPHQVQLKESEEKAIIGSYFMFYTWMPIPIRKEVSVFLQKNADIVKYCSTEVPVEGSELEKNVQQVQECTLHEELRSPAYRPSVLELRARKKTTGYVFLHTINLAKRRAREYPRPVFIRRPKDPGPSRDRKWP